MDRPSLIDYRPVFEKNLFNLHAWRGGYQAEQQSLGSETTQGGKAPGASIFKPSRFVLSCQEPTEKKGRFGTVVGATDGLWFVFQRFYAASTCADKTFAL